MKFQIQEKQNEVSIEIEKIDGQQQVFQEAFQKCREGKCSCPTTEYDKLQSLKIEPTQHGVLLRLKPKEGERFNLGEIEKCLEHTAREISEK